MTAHKLTIRFAGICTHFRYGVAAGVPHRVVLPDAARFTAAVITMTASAALEPKPVLYYLMPHFAQLETYPPFKLDVPPLDDNFGPSIVDGDVLGSVRLQVVNAVASGVSYADDTYRLTEFVSNYAPSTDVALNGRAAVYFDLYGGEFSKRVGHSGATQTVVEITTDGPPVLLVTSLGSSDVPTRAARLSLGNAPEIKLDVKNMEAVDVRERKLDYQGGAFDFLLHYLTSTGGIPSTIKELTPGMDEQQLVSATREQLARAMEGMADILEHPQARRVLVSPDELTPSCSDSQYP